MKSSRSVSSRFRRTAVRANLGVETLEKRNLLARMLMDSPLSMLGQVEDKHGDWAAIDSSLVATHEQFQLATGITGTASRARASQTTTSDDLVLVELVAKPVSTSSSPTPPAVDNEMLAKGTEKLRADLAPLDIRIVGTSRTGVTAAVHAADLPKIAALPSLRFAHSSTPVSNRGLVVSQGDQAMRSDIARSLYENDGGGYNGSAPITVGVLSDSYNHEYLFSPFIPNASDDVASGDLPADSIILKDGYGVDEGRAMMQLVADVAPEARLAFHTAFEGQAGFAEGIRRLANEAQADVLVDDVSYLEEPMFQESLITQAIDEVASKGVAYFSSAGNRGRLSYESPYRNSGLLDPYTGGLQHDFDMDDPATAHFDRGYDLACGKER